ncbi:hypothetical protein ACT3QO_14770, partial [Psychrobacter sp. AOP7-D1-15]|uniref:hypothetical protein n=1 Tax=Psychrobacter sp. AOP7-D1-15 TaxID=3457637 RepID=UPI00402BB49B
MRSLWSAKCTASEESLSQHNAIFNVPLLYRTDYTTNPEINKFPENIGNFDSLEQLSLGGHSV